MNKLFLLLLFLGSASVAMQPEQELPLFKMPPLDVLQKRLNTFGKWASHPAIQELADQELSLQKIDEEVNRAVYDPDIYCGKRDEQARVIFASLLLSHSQALRQILLQNYLTTLR